MRELCETIVREFDASATRWKERPTDPKKWDEFSEKMTDHLDEIFKHYAAIQELARLDGASVGSYLGIDGRR